MPGFGTSMRDCVLTGPSGDQPRSVQYDVASANRVTFRSVTHFVADTYPYSPGTTMRTGKPCSTGSGSPSIAIASSALRSSVSAASGVEAP